MIPERWKPRAQPESPEEFSGRRRLPGCGWSRQRRQRPAAPDQRGCVLRDAAWGRQCFPPSPTRPFGGSQARTRSAGSPTRGQRGTGSPARLDRRHFTSLPHTAGAGTAGERRADRSQQIWQRQLGSEVQLHGSTARAGGAGEGKEEETTTCNARRGGEEVISGTRRTSPLPMPSQL